MWFVSSFVNIKIYDISEEYVGKVVDLLFTPKDSDYPKIEYLLIQTGRNKRSAIDLSQVNSVVPNSSMSLDCSKGKINFAKIDPQDFVSMRDSVLDQQIVDLKNAHVIRVNDVKLGFIKGKLKALGVDISFAGMMRRMGFQKFSLFGLFRPIFIDWKEIQILKGESIKVNTMVKKLKTIHPADLADIIEKINSKESAKILDSLEEKTIARIIEEADDDARKQIIHQTKKSDLKEIFENMDTDDIVDVVQDLPQDLKNKVTSTFDEETKTEVVKLANYQEDTVGGLMTTDFIEVSGDLTVRQAIAHFRKVSKDYRSVLYIYVVDDESGSLLGSVSARGLICAKSGDFLRNICKQIPAQSMLQVDQGINEIIAIMTKYNLYNAAVGDEGDKMIGLVTIDDVLRVMNPDV